MTLTRRLLPPSQDRDFDLLDTAADLVCQAASVLVELAADPAAIAAPAATAARLTDLTSHSGRITSQIRDRLGSPVTTPLDPADLLTLAAGLHDTMRAVTDTAARIAGFQLSLPLPAAAEQAGDLLRTAQATAEAIGGLRHLRPRPRRQRPAPTRLLACCQAIDRLRRDSRQRARLARADLYAFTGEHPTRYVLQWADILGRVEHAIDRLAGLARRIVQLTLTQP